VSLCATLPFRPGSNGMTPARVMLAGRPRFVARLDEEFALVYDLQRKAMLPEVGAGLMAEIDWRAGARGDFRLVKTDQE